MSDERKFTDADLEVLAKFVSPIIVDQLEERVKTKFYTDLGKGAWGLFKSLCVKVFWTAVMFVAAYGAVKGAGQAQV